jgi:hypothetical protein
MESQFFEGGCCDVPPGGVPTDAAGRTARAKEVRERFSARFAATATRFRSGLADWYGPERAKQIRHAEAFEVCEYGRQPTRIEIARLFPFFPPVTEAAGAPWVPLFNGKDLTGWKPHGAERWVVEQGEILGETLTKEYGYLSTEKTFRDFELKVKFKAEGAGNSGVFFHSSLTGTDIAGVQAEVDPRPNMHSGGLYEAAGRGWLIKPEEAAEKAMRVGEWNDMRVLVRGPHVRTWVNGVPAVDYVDPAPKYTDGVIALQLHSGGEGRMRFKDIVIREIK